MAEPGDQRWRVDDIRDTSMQTRLIPLSALEDEGFDVADDSANGTGATSATPPQPLPPSFYPTNTGRMRPIIPAQASPAAPASSVMAAPSTPQPARSGHDSTPQTAPFSSVAPRTPATAANTSDSLSRIAQPASDPDNEPGAATDQTSAPPHVRISYSLQYRALHPRD
ncbi:hypothetical protein [Bifidobacterium aerophilum]|uniref:Uncharacterized protein n=1 Tax=Bifidobacterium aerophilum TaxID=1798155 RepID=A0A6N9Z444_9BIFI|nr:hypothetical protein [Bifidobacterium aerophilum]NEG89114.1 hypothetical protein [Bifidobacterium aerophilum]